MLVLWLALVSVGGVLCDTLPTPASLEVKNLPGLTFTPKFKQYAGYVPATSGTHMFFWFVESQRDPATDPVCLWLNGGPGASSIAYGFWTEHGPYRLDDKGNVNENPSSWNRIANMIYLDAPSGVGYSYSDDPKHYKTNDTQTAIDNYQFLLNFFKVFTTFQSNPFFVTGESYGGHYVPTLSMQILENTNSLNMKGFIIGNPGINSDWYFNINEYAFQTYLWSHALLPEIAYQKSFVDCNWVEFLDMSECKKNFTDPSAKCRLANTEAYKYVPKVWDPYDVLAPTCHTGKEAQEGDEFVSMYTPFLAQLRKEYGINTTYNPCLDRYTAPYMTRKDVMAAVHAINPDGRHWPSAPRGWKYGTERADIALLFPTFFEKAPQWRIAIYSGDADSAVPFMGTERWINCLGRTVKKDWYNWMFEKDVAGSVKKWDNIMFFTIKGCGHTVPTYCPEKSYSFWEKWMSNTL